jgi:hypothetical protein
MAVEVHVPSQNRAIVGTVARFTVGEAFISTEEHLRDGTEVIVRLMLPDGMIRAEGMVVSRTPPANVPTNVRGFTVVFEDVLPADRERIAAASCH